MIREKEIAATLHATAMDIALRLQMAGYEAFVVEPGDYDIVTSARPYDMQKLFPHTVSVGPVSAWFW